MRFLTFFLTVVFINMSSLVASAEDAPVRLCGLVKKVENGYQMEINELAPQIALVSQNDFMRTYLDRVYAETVGDTEYRLRACAHGTSLPAIGVADGLVVYSFIFSDLTPFLEDEGTEADMEMPPGPDQEEDGRGRPERSRGSGFTIGN